MSPSQQLTIEQAISQAEKAIRQGIHTAIVQQFYDVIRHLLGYPITCNKCSALAVTRVAIPSIYTGTDGKPVTEYR